MNNLDTQTVKGIVGKILFLPNNLKTSCIKTENVQKKWTEGQILRKARPNKIRILERWRRCKKDSKFIISIIGVASKMI